jgi:hypothetical protein
MTQYLKSSEPANKRKATTRESLLELRCSSFDYPAPNATAVGVIRPGLAQVGVSIFQKYPAGFCVGASLNASHCNKMTNSQAGRKFFSRAPIDTAACDRGIFDTANAICFARSKSKGEKECITERNNRTFRRNWPTT